MKTKKPSLDYIDEDVAYFIGLITARGEISDQGGVKRISIEFPFRNLEVEGIKKKITQKDKILLSLDNVINRVNELADVNVRKTESERSIYLVLETLKNTMFLRNVKMLMKGRSSYYEFEVPDQIFQSSDSIKKEFVRGFADVAGSARWANRNRWGKCRVYLDVLNSPSNWRLPVQMCHLLQDHLGIPIDVIQWGHPNTRDPSLKEYQAGRKDAWAREHQIKIFADDFEKIGFYMSHKQEILEELAEYNREQGFTKANFCNPPKRRKTKPRHPSEASEKLPPEIRGKHYDSYWQICADLGCFRYANFLESHKQLTKWVKSEEREKR
ncbi:MAG: hypothetical protein QXO30_02070 [Candidatus Caldarchaeum sp.]